MKIPPGRITFAELPADTILSRQEVAEGLGLRPRQIERLGMPCYGLGTKTKLYRKGDVLAWLEERRTQRRAS